MEGFEAGEKVVHVVGASEGADQCELRLAAVVVEEERGVGGEAAP